MFVILTYDVGVRRVSKMLKISKKYLSHVQKSVLEGQLTDRQYEKLKKDILRVTDPEHDSIILYTFKQNGEIAKQELGTSPYREVPVI